MELGRSTGDQLAPAAYLTSIRSLSQRVQFVEGWLQLQGLLDGETFTCNLTEERDVKLVSVRFIPSCAALYLKPMIMETTEPEETGHHHQHHHHGGVQELGGDSPAIGGVPGGGGDKELTQNRIDVDNGGQVWNLSKCQLIGLGEKINEETKVRNLLELPEDVVLNGDNCLSLYHGRWPWKEIQLVSQNEVVPFVWEHWLKAFMHQESLSLSSVDLIDAWLLSKYSKLKLEEGGTVIALDAICNFTGFKRWKACSILASVIGGDETLAQLVIENFNDISFVLYQYLYYTYIAVQRVDIRRLYHKCTTTKADDDYTDMTSGGSYVFENDVGAIATPPTSTGAITAPPTSMGAITAPPTSMWPITTLPTSKKPESMVKWLVAKYCKQPHVSFSALVGGSGSHTTLPKHLIDQSPESVYKWYIGVYRDSSLNDNHIGVGNVGYNGGACGMRLSQIAGINTTDDSSKVMSYQASGGREKPISSSIDNKMSIFQFHKFLCSSQGCVNQSLSSTKEIMQKYDFHSSEEIFLSLSGFAHYLLSINSRPFSFNKPQLDDSHPISSYFISSSHNTYLTGHQLHGESSVDMYSSILRSGCRCVEIDCWDGEDNDPIVYHGHTLTTKIKFKDVVAIIAENAFVSTSYPLIISIENHCNVHQQVKMASYMKEAFGKNLLSDFIDGNPDPSVLPPLRLLKNKILIKNRKIHSNSNPVKPYDLPNSSSNYSLSVAIKNAAPLYSPLMFSKSFQMSQSSTPNSSGPNSPLPVAGHHDSSLLKDMPTKDEQRDGLYSETKSLAGKRNLTECRNPTSTSLNGIPMSTIPEDGSSPMFGRNKSRSLKCNGSRYQQQLVPDMASTSENHHVTNKRIPTKQRRSLPATLNPTSVVSFTLGSPVHSAADTSTIHDHPEPYELDISRKGESNRKLPDGRRRSNHKLEVDTSESAVTLCNHNVLDLSSPHEAASRSSSNDSSNSSCSHFPLQQQKSPVPVVLSPTPSLLQTESSPEPLYIPQHGSINTDREQILPSPHSMPTMSTVSSRNRNEAVMTLGQSLSDSVEDLSMIADSNLVNLRMNATDLSAPIFAICSDDDTDNDSASTVSNSSVVSLFSILTDLGDLESDDAQFGSAQNSPNEPKKRSISWSSVPTKMNLMYNTVMNLPAGPASVAARKKFRKSSTHTPTAVANSVTKKQLTDYRRGSIGTLQLLMGRGDSRNPVHIDTVEASYHRSEIAQELSDLVIYTEAKKFPGFKDPDVMKMKCTEMFSVNESAAKKSLKKTPTDMIRFTRNHFIRIYPSASRFNSSNFNPAAFWSHGCQMVALNYQTQDISMEYYHAFFGQENSCGYILKPKDLRPIDRDSVSEDTVNSSTSTTELRLSILSVLSDKFRSLIDKKTKPDELPYVEVQVLGMPHDCIKFKLLCTCGHGVCLSWEKDNTIMLKCTIPEITALKFTLNVKKVDIQCSEIVFWNQLKSGYQHIYFTNDSITNDYPPIGLFLHVKKIADNKNYSDDEDELYTDQVFNDECHVTADLVTCSPDDPEPRIDVLYNELPGLKVQVVSLTEYSSTTVKDVLMGAVTNIPPKEIEKICSVLKNSNDESKVMKYFELYLARQLNDYQCEKIKPLQYEDLLYHYTSRLEKCCLLVCLKRTPKISITANSTSSSMGVVSIRRHSIAHTITQENKLDADSTPVHEAAPTGISGSSSSPARTISTLESAHMGVKKKRTLSGRRKIFKHSHPERQSSNSSVFEVTSESEGGCSSSVVYNSSLDEPDHSLATAQGNTGGIGTRGSGGRSSFNLKNRLRQKIFGKRKVKAFPGEDTSSTDEPSESGVNTIEDTFACRRLHRQKSISNLKSSSFRQHPCSRFSTTSFINYSKDFQ